MLLSPQLWMLHGVIQHYAILVTNVITCYHVKIISKCGLDTRSILLPGVNVSVMLLLACYLLLPSKPETFKLFFYFFPFYQTNCTNKHPHRHSGGVQTVKIKQGYKLFQDRHKTFSPPSVFTTDGLNGSWPVPLLLPLIYSTY